MGIMWKKSLPLPFIRIEMIPPSTIVVLALLFALLAMILVIVLLIRTTRKVVDNNAQLIEQMKKTSVDRIKEEVSSVEQPMKMEDDQLMAWLEEKMQENPLYQQPDLDLKTMAEALGISQRRIIRLLKSQPKYGSFSAFITEKRLEKACELLKSHPEFTIEGISQDAGFASRRTFQTVFKNHLGMSPSEYRSAVLNKTK